VDVRCAITILSESLLEMLDFSFETFRDTNDLGSLDERRKNSLFSMTSDGDFLFTNTSRSVNCPLMF
jgi:hypothetical protein